MRDVLLVGIGGFFGATLRYLVSKFFQHGINIFPIGTLIVNFTGSLLLSTFMFASFSEGLISKDATLFLAVGLLGAFTTMSTFGFDTFKLWNDQQIWLSLLNILSNVLLSLFGIYLGKYFVLGV